MYLDGGIVCENKFWYLVHCQAKKEMYAANSLKHILQLGVFLPEIQSRSHGTIKCSPLFPGYIFINADLQKVPKSRINTCPGVLRLVEFDDEPQSVPQSIIDTITLRLNECDWFHMHSGHKFSYGDAVRMKCGPLRDLEMIFVSTSPTGRVRVLLELLGRMKEVKVDIGLLEKV